MVGQFESGKDTVQVLTESAATHVGNIATIVTGAVRDIARETGDWLTELIEMREAANRAKADHDQSSAGADAG
ncbi:hypothetical protein BAY61_15575 [Prauserella marina]|uniref:Uncharacterized protein n=1 Tax=Prauserella marina TaxID=530584 RepID=A0A222VR33_9PSEU|nr:hypothetical protein [Prauserella marina]ASR36191.1 hypothetical protein BAY61_15575 [Prauserella marina]PWV76943.1 hypothetical protein DES30_105160 [Prauserella marina]SDD00849.1 hypothetical protein SAMN05421630_105161 [Prauserella marina]